MVIDIHTHIFPPKLAPHAIKALESSAGAHAFLNGTKEDLIKSMRENGIDISVNMPVASRADQVHSINNYAIEAFGLTMVLYIKKIIQHPFFRLILI